MPLLVGKPWRTLFADLNVWSTKVGSSTDYDENWDRILTWRRDDQLNFGIYFEKL